MMVAWLLFFIACSHRDLAHPAGPGRENPFGSHDQAEAGGYPPPPPSRRLCGARGDNTPTIVFVFAEAAMTLLPQARQARDVISFPEHVLLVCL